MKCYIGQRHEISQRRKVGGKPSDSSREELDEKRRPKRLDFSVRELAINPSGRMRGGKTGLQKLLEIFLV